MRRLFSLLFIVIFIVACAPQNISVGVDRQVITVYADVFSEDALPALYACAERSPELLLSRTPDIDSANIILRLTPDPGLSTTLYQVAEIEFVLAINVENPLSGLSTADIEAIYSGRMFNWAQLGWDDAPVHLWVYDPETGLNGLIFGPGRPSSLAKQAQSPRAMRDANLNDPYAIGFLPSEETLRQENIQILPFDQKIILPVLAAIPDEDPNILALVACLQ